MYLIFKKRFKLPVSVKKYGRTVKAAYGFFYDFIRYVKYSAWQSDISKLNVRNYHLVKIYHALEKSMSYKNRDKRYGWQTAELLLVTLVKGKEFQPRGQHDSLAVKVLLDFINLPENQDDPRTNNINQILLENNLVVDKLSEPSVLNYSITDFQKGILDLPEDFFFSRFTLREFNNKKVSKNIIKRAVALSLKTPSVCNRQPWHVYHTSSREVIDQALAFQSGNKGFGDGVPNLMIITTDLEAFMPGEEHYQHWIDGGLMSMSLIYAFHSLGIASCCLNWSQSPSTDRRLRKALNIESNHTVIMMLAYGYPDKNNIVCASARRSLEGFITELESKV